MNPDHASTSAQRADGQRGFSLVELMIAVALLSVLLAGLTELIVTSSQNATATAKLSRIQETGRIAIQMLSSDIRRAGYFGGHAGLTNFGGTLAVPTPAAACVADTTAWSTMVGQPVFGVNDTNAGYACIADSEYLQGDILTLRNSAATPVAVADMVATRPYIRTSLFEGKAFLGANQASADNDVVSRDAREFALVAHSYFVGPSGRSCQGVSIPALFRKSVDDAGLPVTQELLAGVEHLQFKYMVGDEYVDANDIALADWANVTAVEIAVLVRAECPELDFVNNRTFVMGDLASPYGPADGYRRQLFTSLASVRN